MYFYCSYEALMKNAPLFNGKPTDRNQDKLWMQRVMALTYVNHPVNVPLSLLSKVSFGISKYQTLQKRLSRLKCFYIVRNLETEEMETEGRRTKEKMLKNSF